MRIPAPSKAAIAAAFGDLRGLVIKGQFIIRSEVDAGRRRFRDFLILTRKKRGIASYADQLKSRNIRVEAGGGGAFGESPDVKVLTVLLRALADP